MTVTRGGVTLLEYSYCAQKPKPYVHPLCLPDGRSITLDSPEDHVHHRGLMVAWSEVNGFDFWGEVNPARHGRIVHQRFEQLSEAGEARIVAINHWISEDDRLQLVERRTITIPQPSPEGLWLDWITELHAPREPVQLAAGQHVYNGLGIRVIPEMDGGSVRNSRGTSSIEGCNGEAAAWCAYGSERARAGVAFFDHPQNPRHPNAFFVMNKPFGYLSAAPTFREPFALRVNQPPLRFRWGVLSFPGSPDPRRFDRLFQRWSHKS